VGRVLHCSVDSTAHQNSLNSLPRPVICSIPAVTIRVFVVAFFKRMLELQLLQMHEITEYFAAPHGNLIGR